MAKTDKYEQVAEQIGDLGAELDAQEQGLGKLKNKQAYDPHALSPEEEASKNAFLERERKMKERLNQQYEQEEAPRTLGVSEDVSISEGWVPIVREQMGIRSEFYPEDWDFYIRPATVQAIKNWIGIDEKNALQMNNTFDEIIKMCVRIKEGQQLISWSHINTWDRFWFILKVRELTFASNKQTITFEDNCSECDEEITFELRASSLHYEFPDEDIVKKHWNAADMEWNIDPAEYGVDGEENITLWVPTLAKQQAIIDWAQRQYQRKKKLDETFVSTFLPWMINKASRDETQFDRQVQKIEKIYKAWSVPMYELMSDIIRNITINPKETLKATCPHCGEEVISNVQFPNGIKVLFAAESKVQKFGSR